MTKYNISIDLAKIDELKIKLTVKGQKFANFDLIIRDEVDSYGNIGFIVQQQSKEEREQQVKLPILGNAKRVEKRVEPQPPHQSDFKPLPTNTAQPKEKIAKVEPIVTEFYQHKGSQTEWDLIKPAPPERPLPPIQTSFMDTPTDLPF
jgi:hypothetical protein